MSIRRPAKILVVDDVSFLRVVLRDILVHQEIASTVYEAADGLEAVEAYEKFRPDIVALDIVMPRMDGIQALKKIISINPKAKIIIISSEKNRAAVQEAIKLGAQDYILKPFDRIHVGPVFDKVMRQKD
ncbi:MAG: response regulator [Thaumarchaeota archaeon]|nr:response regulator [Nitrososphaerota archaeon]